MNNGLNTGLPNSTPFHRPEPSQPRRPIHQVVGKGPAWRKNNQLPNPEIQKIKPQPIVSPDQSPVTPLKKPFTSPAPARAMPLQTPHVAKKLLPIPGTSSAPVGKPPVRLPPSTAVPLARSLPPIASTSTAPVQQKESGTTPAATRAPQLTRTVAARPLPSPQRPLPLPQSAGTTKPLQPLAPGRVLPQAPAIGKQPIPQRLDNANVGRALPTPGSGVKPPPFTYDKLLANNYTHENIRITPSTDKAAHHRDSQVFGFLTTNINFQNQMKNTKSVIDMILSLPEPIQKNLLLEFNKNHGGNLQISDLTYFKTHITQLIIALDRLNKDLFEALNKHGILQDKNMTDPVVVELLAIFTKHSDALFGQANPVANHPHYVDMQNLLNDDRVKVLVRSISVSPNTDFIQVTSATSRYRSLFDPIVEKMPSPNKEKAKEHAKLLDDKLSKMNAFDQRLNIRLLANQSQFSEFDLSDIHKFLLSFEAGKDKGDTMDVKFAQTLLKHIQENGLDSVTKDKLETMSWKYTIALYSFLEAVDKKNPGLLPADALKKVNTEIKKSLQKTNDRIKSKKILSDLDTPIDTTYVFKKEFDATQTILKSKS